MLDDQVESQKIFGGLGMGSPRRRQFFCRYPSTFFGPAKTRINTGVPAIRPRQLLIYF